MIRIIDRENKSNTAISINLYLITEPFFHETQEFKYEMCFYSAILITRAEKRLA